MYTNLIYTSWVEKFSLTLLLKTHGESIVDLEKRLYRSRTDRQITGLCGGLGEYFGVDPTIIRIGTVVGSFLSGFWGVPAVYFLLSLIIREEP